jgi:hypothetical protein
MPIEIPPRGTVFEYPYRWAREAASGASPDGRKDRTVCLVLTVTVSANRHALYLLVISSKPPRENQVALPIPDTERRRAGLNRYPAAWVYISEFNRDVAEESFYFEPNANRLGVFSPAFVLEVSRALAARIEAGGARAIERNG